MDALCKVQIRLNSQAGLYKVHKGIVVEQGARSHSWCSCRKIEVLCLLEESQSKISPFQGRCAGADMAYKTGPRIRGDDTSAGHVGVWPEGKRDRHTRDGHLLTCTSSSISPGHTQSSQPRLKYRYSEVSAKIECMLSGSSISFRDFMAVGAGPRKLDSSKVVPEQQLKSFKILPHCHSSRSEYNQHCKLPFGT